MKNNLNVFLCGTYTDLAEERKQILLAIRKLHFQHVSMEFFGARPKQAIETCLEEVRRSDLLVVVVGHRYGSLVPGRNLSFSEAEYEEGYRLDKPCLVYMRSDEVPLLPKFVERDPDNLRRLELWKSTLLERHTVAQFSDMHDLALQVSADLSGTVQSIQDGQLKIKPLGPLSLESMISEISDVFQEALNQGIAEYRVLSVVRRAVNSLLIDEGEKLPIVFLSYAHKDREIVSQVAEGLHKAGINTWFDRSNILPGDSLHERITRALDSAQFVIFFISPTSLGGGWVQDELNIAISRQFGADHGPEIIPVLLDGTEIPPFLRNVRYIDLRDHDVRRGTQEIIDAIRYRKRK